MMPQFGWLEHGVRYKADVRKEGGSDFNGSTTLHLVAADILSCKLLPSIEV